MPSYRYETLDAAATSVLEAPDRSTALRVLRQRGVLPVRVEEVAASGNGVHVPTSESPGKSVGTWISGTWGRRAMSRNEMAALIRELATAIQAGLPLVQALRTIARQGRSDSQRAMLASLIDQVEHGRSLADAAQSYGRPFSDLTISLMRAGEASGRLGQVLSQCAVLLDRDVKLRRSLLSATLYPMILCGLVAIAIAIVVTVIVPNILKPLAGQLSVSQLPMPTRIVQWVAAMFGGYWWAIILLAFGAALMWQKAMAEPASRLAIDRTLLRSPILGPLLRDVAVARFTRTLGTLVSAGLPVLSALRITKDTLGNRALEVVIEDVCEKVASGRTISEPMERSGLFPPLLVQIVGLGERSGRLPQLLAQAADAFEEQTETSIKVFTTALPPILVVLLACVVGFVVAAVLLPLLQLQEMIG